MLTYLTVVGTLLIIWILAAPLYYWIAAGIECNSRYASARERREAEYAYMNEQFKLFEHAVRDEADKRLSGLDREQDSRRNALIRANKAHKTQSNKVYQGKQDKAHSDKAYKQNKHMRQLPKPQKQGKGNNAGKKTKCNNSKRAGHLPADGIRGQGVHKHSAQNGRKQSARLCNKKGADKRIQRS